MDTDQLISHGRARFEHAAARRLLQERYQAKMVFAYAGGMWRAGPDLLNLLSVCTDAEVVILDLYETPIRIKVAELRDQVYQRWQEQMTAWLIACDGVSQQR
jgi:hypothetical protein